MYLRRVWDNGCCRYVIRESYRDGDCWQCRDLFHLGEDPRACIIYPGGNGFYFSEELEDSLQEKGVDYTSRDLEELFFPFLPPHIRRVLTNFGHCGTSGRRRCSLSTEEELRAQQELHSFDKRRIHFLRCGRVDIGRLEGRNWPFLNILLEKSRDEIEHVFDEMERRLRPTEIRSYIYTAFQIETYFTGNFLKHHPAALDPEKVDEFLLEEVCCVNRDTHFFSGVDSRDSEVLHPILLKYIILYFDHDWDYQSPWKQYIEELLRRRNFSARAGGERAASMTEEDACRKLGVTVEEYTGMTRRELIRVFRMRAKEIHPDKGGDHDVFIKVTEAYEYLLLKKR